MTIHRAKGLEFPVVCVADLGRKAGGTRSPLLVGPDGTAGLRLAPLGGGDTIPTTAWERLNAAELDSRGRGGAAPVLRRDDPRQGAADPLAAAPTSTSGPPRAPAARRSTGSSRAIAGTHAAGATSSCSRAQLGRPPGPRRRAAQHPRQAACSRRPRCRAARAPARGRAHDRAAGQARVRPAAAAAGAAGAAAAVATPSSPTTPGAATASTSAASSGCPTSTHLHLRSSLRLGRGSTRGRAVRSSTKPWRTSISTLPRHRPRRSARSTDLELSRRRGRRRSGPSWPPSPTHRCASG